MFTIKSYSDVIAVANTFGRGALDHAIANHTLTQEASQMIFDCIAWAASTVINLESFNDGNIDFSVDAVFESQKIDGNFLTQLHDITIVRTGFGAYAVSVNEAMTEGYITTEQLRKILSTIKDRNNACKSFGF